MKEMPDQESSFTADYAAGFQFTRNLARRRAAFQENKSLGAGRNRHEYGPGKPPSKAERGQQQNCQKFAQVASSLDELAGFPVNRWLMNPGKYPPGNPLKTTFIRAAP